MAHRHGTPRVGGKDDQRGAGFDQGVGTPAGSPRSTPRGRGGPTGLLARVRLGLEPRDVGDLLRRSLHLDSELDGETVDALLDLALPPSAKEPRTG